MGLGAVLLAAPKIVLAARLQMHVLASDLALKQFWQPDSRIGASRC